MTKAKVKECATSHELARRLLALPDLPVIIHAHNHEYRSDEDRRSYGPLNIALSKGSIQRVRIGDFNLKDDLEEDY